ncbi:heavy metal translocating P-type ATPase [Campylobacter majalis]|uniref:heavy metal translocating P-type ATPase n=1 Tax=Campylobacter majalis TaxID=2790656 RepID=UPI003D68536A
MQKVKLNIAGMSCVNCSNSIERVAKKIDGVSEAKVSFANGTGEFCVANDDVLKILKTKISNLGFEIVFNANEYEKKRLMHIKELKSKLISSAVICAIIMAIELFLPINFASKIVMFLLAAYVIFRNGSSFFTHAIKSIKSKNYDMNVLVSLGAFSAFLHAVFVLTRSVEDEISHIYIGSAAMIITFVLLGKFLEERSKQKASDYLKSLMDLSPKTAHLIMPDGQSKEIPVSELSIGDIVVVKNGYNIPSDGEIVQGGAEIDTSALTGESLPSYKSVGESVHAGCVNTNGYISVKITKMPSDTLLSQILSLLSEATTKQMPISRMVDRVANVFVPSIIMISIITFAIWIYAKGDLNYAIIAAVCVLIISCPCALGLATPIAIISGISRGAKDGILIKNPEVLEILKDVKFAVFDKTGTLSKGEISVNNSNLTSNDLALIAGVEALSEHPISKAVVKYAKSKCVTPIKLDGEFKNELGLGVRYKDREFEILIGNDKLLNKYNIQSKQTNEIICVINGEIVGTFSISDTIRDEAKQSIDALKSQGITPIILSGDSDSVVKSVANELGISQHYANKLPDEKFQILKEIQNQGKVLFIGDGINDSLCLKQADVGIAMSSGSDIAKGAGDIVLIKNDLLNVAYTLNLGKKTIRTIKQNLFWAFIYNLICIPVAAGALYPVFGLLLNPMYGALAMCFSSVNVVLNSIRLRFIKIN